MKPHNFIPKGVCPCCRFTNNKSHNNKRMPKRQGTDFAALRAKSAKTAKQTAADRACRPPQRQNPSCLSEPVGIVSAMVDFLEQVQKKAHELQHHELEIEARLGILEVLEPTFGAPRRVASSGPKQQNGHNVEAFCCSQCRMNAGVSRTHFMTCTEGGKVWTLPHISFV